MNAMEKTEPNINPANINPESQDIAELKAKILPSYKRWSAMVKALMKALMLSQEQLSQEQKESKESQWQQERQSLRVEQLKLAFDRQFAKRSEAIKALR
ncbi:hypothetical protein AB6D20_027470 (plasmid) [Vibrio splendidus]